MKKYVERETLICSFFELECNEYYNILQRFHRACKIHSESSFLCLLVEIGRFQGMLSCCKVDGLLSFEEEELLYKKSKFLVLRIKSRVLNELSRIYGGDNECMLI